jgi:hypothetical protein
MTDYLHLTIPEDSDEAEEIRSIDGYNDLERLRKWAEKEVKDDVKQILEENLKSYVDSQINRLEINQRTGELEMR